MTHSKIAALCFGVLGALAAVLTLSLTVFAMGAEPVLLQRSEAASARAEEMMTALCSADFESAESCLYGTPDLNTGGQMESEMGQLLWDAFLGSLSYTMVGDGYASQTGMCQDVVLRSLDLESVTANLKERAQKLLQERVAAAENMEEVYDADHNYRESFVMDVLRDAVADAIREDAQLTQKELTLHMVYEQGQWWVLPEQALMNAISGGIA